MGSFGVYHEIERKKKEENHKGQIWEQGSRHSIRMFEYKGSTPNILYYLGQVILFLISSSSVLSSGVRESLACSGICSCPDQVNGFLKVPKAVRFWKTWFTKKTGCIITIWWNIMSVVLCSYCLNQKNSQSYINYFCNVTILQKQCWFCVFF